MNQERIYQVVLGPVISEKSSLAGEHNQYVFRVAKDSNKREIAQAIAKLFDVEVSSVSTVNVKGKTRRTRFGMGQTSDWKKAYVSLAEGHFIETAGAE